MSKKRLAVELSKLKVFEEPDEHLEQYSTDSDVAAEVLWYAYMNNDMEGKVVADMGAGTGILGIGCLMLGAKKVYFVEKDECAVGLLKENLDYFEFENYEIINKDMALFNKKPDLVIQNPPFGTRETHADLRFLEKAMLLSDIIYTFHKASTKDFIQEQVRNEKFKTTNYFEFDFPLKQTLSKHRKKIERISVGCWRLEKI